MRTALIVIKHDGAIYMRDGCLGWMQMDSRENWCGSMTHDALKKILESSL